MDAIGLIPSFGNLAFTVVAFVAALSIVVAVHEYGHYIVGRWSGIHAEVFSLGFGPVLASRVDRRGTRWQIAALPFGGYVKFMGDADAASATQDESFLERIVDTEREKEIRRSMLGAPLWARAATVAAGPVFNFILAGLIFAAVLLSRGAAIEPPTVASVAQLPGESAGLLPGDRILELEGRPTPDYPAFYEVLEALPVMPTVTYTVERGGNRAEVEGAWPFPVLISSITLNSAAWDAGLRIGDVITAIDGEPLIAFSQLLEIVGESGGRELALTIWRDGESFDVRVSPRMSDLPQQGGTFESRWLIGLTGDFVFQPATGPIGPVEALGLGARQVYEIGLSSVSAMAHIVRGDISACNLRGPIGIAEASGAMASQGVVTFIWFVAVLSAAIGLLNLFPIPVLDGGHLVFHAWEAVAGRPPPERVMRVLLGGGFAILMLLMAFALTNDFRCP